jgi:hypothetical protein
MPKRSKIEQQPADIRKEVDALVTNPALRLEDIVAALKKLNIDLSKSSVHRYQEKIEVVGERIRRSREVASALVERFGDAPEDKQLALNIQFVHSAIMDLMATTDEDGAPITLSPKNAMELSKALNELARASKTDADRLLKLRKDLAEKTIDETDKALKAAKQPGLTKELRDQIRTSVLGKAA